ncbi:hypothetical protein BC827DRAFT_1185250 [Russula dissimulans]|nr:hypothetical protein BC827DRAFT_1185250 [Russula dissimulans]
MPRRLDSNYMIEHYTEVLNDMVREGKLDDTGLSTIDPETIHRVRNVTSVIAVENRVSLPAYDQPTKDVQLLRICTSSSLVGSLLIPNQAPCLRNAHR